MVLDNVWNIHQIASILAFLVYFIIFFTFIGFVIYYIKSLGKFMLAISPIMLIVLFYNFTPYFFPGPYLKYIAEQHMQGSYHSMADYETVEEGSNKPPVKVEKRIVKAEISQETISRKWNEYTYRGLLTEYHQTTEGESVREFYFHRTYQWKTWKFELVGLGNTGDQP